jgi:tRNA-specific 2-thiouridylase
VKGIKIKKRVFVGMSGGVDSSVSSALLKKAGFDVTGVFIKTWSPDFMECTWKDERLDAMRVCAKLDIPFITLDLEKEYKEKVADYMIEEYKKGRTPNPDVMCNKEIKFGAFFNWAMSRGADYVATGHYARTLKKKSGEVMLSAGNDDNKDQSYFLWNIKKEHLDKTLFPVGHLEKSEVRKLAKKFNLPTATKKDSQGVCFLGKVDMKDFLEHYIRPKRGEA